MKNWFFEFILYMFTFSFVSIFFKALVLPEDIIYLFITVLVVGLGMILSKTLLTFLTVKVTFPTRLVAIFLILFGVFYLLETFIPGFAIEKFIVQEKELSWISFKNFEFDKMGVIAILSFLVAFLASLVKFLQDYKVS